MKTIEKLIERKHINNHNEYDVRSINALIQEGAIILNKYFDKEDQPFLDVKIAKKPFIKLEGAEYSPAINLY